MMIQLSESGQNTGFAALILRFALLVLKNCADQYGINFFKIAKLHVFALAVLNLFAFLNSLASEKVKIDLRDC